MVKSFNIIFFKLFFFCEAFVSGFFCDMLFIINVIFFLVKFKIVMF